jgi:hypothetical protein
MAREPQAAPQKTAAEPSPAKSDAKRPPNPSVHAAKAAKAAAVFNHPYGSQPANIDPKTGMRMPAKA